jgi:hypothetical protein
MGTQPLEVLGAPRGPEEALARADEQLAGLGLVQPAHVQRSVTGSRFFPTVDAAAEEPAGLERDHRPAAPRAERYRTQGGKAGGEVAVVRVHARAAGGDEPGRSCRDGGDRPVAQSVEPHARSRNRRPFERSSRLDGLRERALDAPLDPNDGGEGSDERERSEGEDDEAK